MDKELLRFFPRRKNAARLVILAFPHAGGGASAFASWPVRLPGWLDLCAFAVPGRENRIAERPCATWEEMVTLAERAVAEISQPVVLLGHSLGALLAHAVACRMSHSGNPPAHLFVSASAAPSADRRPQRLPRDEAAIVDYARALGGTPEDVLNHPELREAMVSALRADFSVAEDFRLEHARPLGVNSTVLCGRDDPGLSPSQAKRWCGLLGEATAFRIFPGGHFFLYEGRDRVIATILERLRLERDLPSLWRTGDDCK